MTVEAFRLCPYPGCTVHVWGSTREENYCRAHGGNRFDFAEIDDDEFGIPRANAGDSPASRPLEAS